MPNTVLQSSNAEELEVVLASCGPHHTVTGEMRTGAQEQFYLETHACIAVPGAEYGEMEIFSSTQNPTHTQVECCCQSATFSAQEKPDNKMIFFSIV
jgi:xanthine dehydrogenase molybdopterin-binding subunit B